jgi:WD40 repeat protein
MALAAVEGDIAHEGPVSCDDANKHAWRLLSGSRDNTIRVWDMATKCPITTITGHTDDVLGLAIGHRDEFYSASSDHTVR